MSRIPDLEQELLLAAQRRFAPATAPRRGRSVSLAWLRPRVLVPLAAALLAVVVAGSALRGGDPEREVSSARYDPSSRPGVDSLLRPPWRGAIGRSMVDRRFEPVAMHAGEAAGAEWEVTLFAGTEGKVCVAAVPTDRTGRPDAGASTCGPVATVAASAAAGDPALGGLNAGADKLVHGVVAADAREVRVAGRAIERRAELSGHVFTRPLSQAEREDVRAVTGKDVRTLRLRLYAAAFNPDEVRSGALGPEFEVRVTDVRGRTATAR